MTYTIYCGMIVLAKNTRRNRKDPDRNDPEENSYDYIYQEKRRTRSSI